MKPFDKLKSMVGGGNDKTYSYECAECGTQFEATEPNPNYLNCPECNGERVHSAV